MKLKYYISTFFLFKKKSIQRRQNLSNKKNQNLFDFSVPHHNIVKKKIVEQNCHTKFERILKL